MYTTECLVEFHERSHQILKALLTHCCQLSTDELNRELAGFGYATVLLQLHHIIGAERYWTGVLHGRMDVDEDEANYPSIDAMEVFRQQVSSVTIGYLRTASVDELNRARTMMTWGDKEKSLVPARVIMRTQTHIYHHVGQIVAMCRLLGKPTSGMDFPIT